jgi:hypothetical protein
VSLSSAVYGASIGGADRVTGTYVSFSGPNKKHWPEIHKEPELPARLVAELATDINNLKNTILQQILAHFGEGIVHAVQSSWQTFDEWQSRMSASVHQDTWRPLCVHMAIIPNIPSDHASSRPRLTVPLTWHKQPCHFSHFSYPFAPLVPPPALAPNLTNSI